MKAIYFEQHGTMENLRYGDLPRPEPGPDEAVVAVRAAALNRLDLWVLEGWPSLKLNFPHVLGSDGAGVISAVGSQVRDWAPGDRVAVDPTVGCGECRGCRREGWHRCDRMAILGEHLPGFYAEYARVPARNLLALPEHVPFIDAAAASLVFVTAWHSLIKRGGLRPGEDVLIVGAGGGVNTASIQIARLAGAGTIYVIGSSDAKLQQAQALGADVLINRHDDTRWSRTLYKMTGRRGVDIVVDNVGAATYAQSLRTLAKGGRLLTVGNTSGPTFEFDNRYIFGKHLSIIGSTMGPHSDYADVMQLLFNGRLQAVIDTVYPLADGLVALDRLSESDMSGKLVLQIGERDEQ